MERITTWFEAHAGKLVVAAILAVGSYAISVRDLSLRNESDIQRIYRDIEELHNFKDAGDRFTSADGARHEKRLDSLEKCSEIVKERLAKVESKLEGFRYYQRLECAELRGAQ